MAHGTDNIAIQRFCDDQCIVRKSYNDASRYTSDGEYKITVKRYSAVFIHGPNMSFTVTRLRLVHFVVRGYQIP